MRVYVLQEETVIPRPVEEVFEFFSRAENLERLTPSTLSFRILTPLPIEMRQGALIDYQLRLGGFPFRWKTEITIWEPPHRFADNQLKGPYRLWLHEHRFSAHPEGTLMSDTVRYAVPGWIFAPLVHALFVGPRVRAIFAFRKETMKAIYG